MIGNVFQRCPHGERGVDFMIFFVVIKNLLNALEKTRLANDQILKILVETGSIINTQPLMYKQQS